MDRAILIDPVNGGEQEVTAAQFAKMLQTQPRIEDVVQLVSPKTRVPVIFQPLRATHGNENSLCAHFRRAVGYGLKGSVLKHPPQAIPERDTGIR